MVGLKITERKASSFLLVSFLVSCLLVFGFSCTGHAYASNVQAPNDLSATKVTNHSVKLHWSKIPGCSYVIYRAKGNHSFKKLKGLPGESVSYQDKKLKKKTVYRYKIVAKKKGESSASHSISVKTQKEKNASAVTLSKKSFTMKPGKKETLKVQVFAPKKKKPISKSVRFYSSNPSVATVSSKGVITSLSSGSAVISCFAHNGKVARAKVTVQEGVPVLCYHGVATPEEKKSLYRNEKWTVSTTQFESQMKYLHDRGFTAITCGQFDSWYSGKSKLPKKSVLITFDDARSCAIENAPAIMRKYGMRGTVFVIGDPTYMNDREGFGSEHSFIASWGALAKAKAKYPELEYQCHSFGMHQRDGKGSPIAWSSKRAAFDNDFVEFKKLAKEKNLGASYLAYPYGADPKEYRDAAKFAGMKVAFDYGRNEVSTKSDNRWSVPRWSVLDSTSMDVFKERLSLI